MPGVMPGTAPGRETVQPHKDRATGPKPATTGRRAAVAILQPQIMGCADATRYCDGPVGGHSDDLCVGQTGKWASSFDEVPASLGAGTSENCLQSGGDDAGDRWQDIRGFGLTARLPANPQQIYKTSNDFPGAFIREKWQEGYDVTSMAYGAGVWALVMTKGQQNLEQAFATELQFPGEQIRQYWKSGYSVTNLAYGTGLWAVIASKLSDDPLQRYATSVDFPGDAINSLGEDGFAVTVLAYGDGLWAYVVSQSRVKLKQTYATATASPGAKITELWGQGYDITNLAFGDP